MNIAAKLPLALGGMAVMMSVALTTVAFISKKAAMKQEMVDLLEVLEGERIVQLTTLFDDLHSDLTASSRSPTLKKAFDQFRVNFDLLKGNQTRILSGLYGTGSSIPIEDRANTVDAGHGSSYSAIHKSFHDFFRNLQKERGIYDICLISMSGDIVCSVTKEADFATNFVSGPYSSSRLGQAFRAAVGGR